MKCAKVQELISAYVDAEANALEQLALQEHMKGCPACKNELMNQYSIKSMAKGYMADTPDIDITSRVMSRVLAPKSEEVTEVYHSFAAKYSKWMVATFVMALTAAALFSAHMNTADIAGVQMPSPATEYAEYIYEHIRDANSYTAASAGTSMAQQASLIK